MYLPEYAITNYTLNNISDIEFAKGQIDTFNILANWRQNIEKETKVKNINNILTREGLNFDDIEIKKYLDKLPAKTPDKIKAVTDAYEEIEVLSIEKNLTTDDLTKIIIVLTKNTVYRALETPQKCPPQEILAQITQIINWYNSMDAKETHPLVSTAILKANIEYIWPLQQYNSALSDLIEILSLKITNYDLVGLISTNDGYINQYRYFVKHIQDAIKNEDFTQWLEFYTENYKRAISVLLETTKTLARESKLTKASKGARLNARQQKLINYLQDYGILQNKHFPLLFPDLSEDTVLRELKKLSDKGLVVKKGKTKSSRYELT